MMQEILRFTRQTPVHDRQLPAGPTELGLLPVEGIAQHEIPVTDLRKVTGLRSTCPTGLEQRHSVTVAPETNGFGSRLMGKRTM